MSRKAQRNMLKVGAFITTLLLVLMIMIISIGKETAVFERKVELRARVANVSNLKPGSFVELKGIRIGSVSDIQIVSDEEVEIKFKVVRSQMPWIKQDSRIAISTAGLVGDKYLEISGGSSDAPVIRPEDDILRSEGGTDFKQMMDKGENIAATTEKILLRIDKILSALEEGKKVVQAVDALQKSSTNLQSITSELKDAKLAETARKLNQASASLQKVINRVENGPGTMNALIYDDSLHESLRALLGGAQRNKVIKYFIRQSIKNSESKKTQAD